MDSTEQLYSDLFKVLNRDIDIPSLDTLFDAANPKVKDVRGITEIAIGLDANVFLKLAQPKYADLVDYMALLHNGPLIVPGQVVQEFWNNQLSAVSTIAATAKGKFEKFKSEMTKIDPAFDDVGAKINDLLIEYQAEHGHFYDDNTTESTKNLLDTLRKKASVPYVPRMRFCPLADHRKSTKTPPGFRDGGDGDFFVWIDFLYGLQMAKSKGATFRKAVIITNDQKPDWSRNGVAHPLLAAEVMALHHIGFELWNLDEFANAVKALDEEP